MYPTTTRSKKESKEKQNQQKERPTWETKGFESKWTKNLKNLQTNSVFQTSPMKFWNKTLLRTSKTTMCTISVSVFLFSVQDLAFAAKQPKPDYCRKIVVSEFFFVLLYWSCAQNSVHHFCSISVSPKTGHKNAHFFQKPLRLTKIVVWEQKGH